MVHVSRAGIGRATATSIEDVITATADLLGVEVGLDRGEAADPSGVRILDPDGATWGYLRPRQLDVAAPDVSPLGVLTLAASLISRLLGAAAEQRALSAQLAAERRIGAEAERLASIGSFVWEVDEDRLHWSDELHRIYGTTPEEFSGDLAGFTRRVHPDDRERVGAAILLALQKAGSFELEERIVRADGQTRILSTTGHVVTDGDGRPVEVFGACRDVTEHKALEEALAWTQHRFRVLLENSADVVAVIGRGGLMTYIAGRTDLMLGCRPDELVGTTGLRLVHLADVEHVYEAFLRVRETPGGSETVQYRLRHRTDSWRWVESVMVNLRQDEVLRGIVVNTRDVTDRRRAEVALDHQSLHDPLTGLPNRVLLRDRLEQAIRRLARNQKGLAVLIVDLDRFTWLNDSLGSDIADQVLVEVARRLSTLTKPGETLARLGGDEFTLVCEDMDGEVAGAAMARRVADALALPIATANTPVTVRASIGIAYADGGRPVTAESVLRDADAAVHQAKENGRNRYELFSDAARARMHHRVRLEQALTHAIDRGELLVHYQPVIELLTGRLAGFEALARWSSAELGLVDPNEFIDVAEDTGLILPIGASVLREACLGATVWGEQRTIAVNISPRQLAAPGTADQLRAVLADTGLDPSRLCLEITERAFVADNGEAVRGARALKDLGVKIAIDDFGTGYSSLAYLKRFPVDVLKVDRSFVDGIDRRAVDRSITAGIVHLADALGVSVVAEGVERPEQHRILAEMGCGFGQGFLWSPAVPGPQAAALAEGGLPPARHEP